MTESAEKLILEHLKVLCNDPRALSGEVRKERAELRSPPNAVEERLAPTELGIANVREDLGVVRRRLDRLDFRIERHPEPTAA